MKKLAIISSHPIQYNAPVFKMLAERQIVQSKVFYTWGHEVMNQKFDPGFEKVIEWDIPLLIGYDYTFVKNIAKQPGSNHFNGIDNPNIIKEIADWNPDSILLFGWSFKSHLKVLRYFKNKKRLIFRGDSTLLDESQHFSLKKIFRLLFLRWVYSHVDLALYVGTENKRYYIKYGLNNKKLALAPHAIDNERFRQGKQALLREQLNIPGDAIVFLFAGKLEQKKNPLLLLKSFLEMENKGAHLLIVGNGPLEVKLKNKVSTLSPANKDRIHFRDFQNQAAIPGIYKAANVFVLPSQGPGETWGLSVNEAMACSKPVIVSDKCGCYPDLIQEGRNGFVFNSGKKESLVKALDQIMKNDLKIMGDASAAIIKDWNFERISVAIEMACHSKTWELP